MIFNLLLSSKKQALLPSSWLLTNRTVRFSDTDAAGVVHFAQLFLWLHQSWEESLERFGLEAGSIFPGGRAQTPSAALPIVHSSAYFHSPLHVGDLLIIHLKPRLLSTSSFEVASEVLLEDQAVATARLRHVAINPSSRERCRLPEGIERWLEASSVGNIQPL